MTAPFYLLKSMDHLRNNPCFYNALRATTKCFIQYEVTQDR